MKEFVKIELKKISLKNQVKRLIIVNIAILFLLSVFFVPSIVQGETVDFYVFTDMIVKSTFVVWQAVLISSMIIEEFKAKTIMQLYTYPIKRSLIIGVKLGLIAAITLSFSLITHAIQHSLLTVGAGLIPQFSYPLSMQYLLSIVLSLPFLVMIGMMPLTVGLWMKSTIAPVVTSMIVVSLLANMSPDSMPMITNLIAVGIMGVLSMTFVMISIKDMVKNDLIV